MEKLDIWHSSDVEVRRKINELIEIINVQQAEITILKLELGVTDVDGDENM